MFNSTTFPENFFAGALGGALFSFLLASLLFLVLFILAVYIYMSFAYMRIAKHVRYPTPAIAWIPLIGPSLIIAHGARMPWWPILLLIGGVFPYVGPLFFLAFSVFSIIWHWKTYESIARPGWWSLFNIIQPVGLVFLGIVAWGKRTRTRK